jgi:hypothetical protein
MGVLDENDELVHDPSRQLKTVEEGAATMVWCAVSPQLAGLGGVYCENVEVAPVLEGSAVARTGIPARGGGVFEYAINPLSEQLLDRRPT